MNCKPTYDESGAIDAWEGSLTDISRLREAQSQRDHLEIELRLAQKLESLGQLAAGIAHEINTPAQYVSDNIAFLSDSFSDLLLILQSQQRLIELAGSSGVAEHELAPYRELVTSADLPYLLEELPLAVKHSRQGIEQIRRIVIAMKEFSHPGSEEKKASDINAAIRNVLMISRNEWKNVADIELDLSESMPLVECMLSWINQAVLNLVINAAHAIKERRITAPSRGMIKISTRADGDAAVLTITDDGCGIREDIRNRIFDPFFTTKEVGHGTGQGLAVTRSVVIDKHRGSISVDSIVGKGTTFVIAIPIVAVDDKARAIA
jgi:signal transduction histidine kinase